MNAFCYWLLNSNVKSRVVKTALFSNWLTIRKSTELLTSLVKSDAITASRPEVNAPTSCHQNW